MRRMIARWIVVSTLGLSVVVPWGMSRSVAVAAPSTTTASRGQLPTWQVLVGANTVPHLSHPEGLAIDQRGMSVNKWLYLVDTGNDRVIKLGTGGHYLGSWGSPGTGPGQFQQPAGIAVDSRGDVYVADTGNNRIQQFGAQGRFLTQWGTKGSAPGQFNAPSAVAVGGSGNVFVADRINNRIEKFSPAGRLLAVWPVFIPRQPCDPCCCFPGNPGAAGPYALTVDPAGNVYAAVDTGQCASHCVMDYIAMQTFSPSGKIVRTVVGGDPYGQFAYGPIPGVTSVQGPWWQIGALTVDARGHLFLAEWNPENRASVTELTSSAKRIGQWELPKPSGARGWPPQGIALDPRGNVYVADSLANRVLKLVFDRL
jgi:tripartite motif-containing protein 71